MGPSEFIFYFQFNYNMGPWASSWQVYTAHCTHFRRQIITVWCRPGRGDPESKFGETFGFALFRQGSISFARFLPENGQKMGKNGQIRVCLFLPKFTRICSFSFVVRMRSLPPSGPHYKWKYTYQMHFFFFFTVLDCLSGYLPMFPVNDRDSPGTSRDKQGQAGTSRDKAGTNRDIPFLSLLVPVRPWLSILVPACPCLSLSVPSCPCLSLSVPVCLCLSFSVPVCPCLSLSASVCPCMSLSVRLSLSDPVYPCMSLHWQYLCFYPCITVFISMNIVALTFLLKLLFQCMQTLFLTSSLCFILLPFLF